jgi:hypothetical protein
MLGVHLREIVRNKVAGNIDLFRGDLEWFMIHVSFFYISMICFYLDTIF